MWCAPNDEVIEAQKRVCQGLNRVVPCWERDSPDPKRILDLILKTVSGEILPDQAVSYSQIGAFFAAMCIRRTFDDSCNWSPAEEKAFTAVSKLLKKLPPGLKFLLDGKGSLIVLTTKWLLLRRLGLFLLDDIWIMPRRSPH